MMMMTQFNLQPPTKNTNTQRATRPAESQSLHVEIQGVYAKEIAPHIAPLQKKIKWYSRVVFAIVAIVTVVVLISLGFQLVHFVSVSHVLEGFQKQSVQISPLAWIIPAGVILSAIFSGKNWLMSAFSKSLPFQTRIFEWLIGNDYQTLVISPLLKQLNPELLIAA